MSNTENYDWDQLPELWQENEVLGSDEIPQFKECRCCGEQCDTDSDFAECYDECIYCLQGDAEVWREVVSENPHLGGINKKGELPK